jgi:hypothetical protein
MRIIRVPCPEPGRVLKRLEASKEEKRSLLIEAYRIVREFRNDPHGIQKNGKETSEEAKV